jgi:hypothetical protein
MIELKGDLWDFHKEGHWICITTNGTIKSNGSVVMGRGCVLELKRKFKGIEFLIGQQIKRLGNIPFVSNDDKIITFPVKHNWWEVADIDLIRASAKIIRGLVNGFGDSSEYSDYYSPMLEINSLYIPRPGCGNGKLDWKDVKKVLEPIFDDERYIIITK